MSKVGRAPITIPDSVTISLSGQALVVKGSKGELSHTIPSRLKVEQSHNLLTVTRSSNAKPVRALHGLTRALIANMVKGVSEGYRKTLELVGTGYRAKLEGNKLTLSLGFSHDVEFQAPAGITLKLEGNNIIHIEGFDKQLVGLVAAKIRDFKKPEPYKGKGIRYQGEYVRRKAGKAAKTAAA